MLYSLEDHELMELYVLGRLEDLVQRRARQETVDDLVSLDRIRGMLRTAFWRKRFLQYRAGMRQRSSNVVPAIVLDAPDGHEDEDGYDAHRPSLSLDTSNLSMSPPPGFRTPMSTPPAGDLLSPRASMADDGFFDRSSSPATNRWDSTGTARRPSMGDDFVNNIAQSEWMKMFEEELAKADD